MNEELNIRAYKTTDQEAVLNLLRLNTPQYFSTEEENDLVYYLENEIEHYFVIEINQQIVGSGGFNFSGDKTTGKISWDIFHPEFQRKSLGTKLLNYRIQRLQTFKEVKKITVRTSQLAYQFYEKQGFKLLEIVEDYWAKGFHLYTMEYIKKRY
ncbi:MAG: GNAT family N-acetyltransferase [Pyrinomonadaceae bacterium]|nr:GNAT family N-acetyltransferase [Sphingobacteriaceae bacterium]